MVFKSLKAILLSICLIFVVITYAFGGVPQLINYQGTLTTAAGAPVPDGQYAIVFNIYDVTTGGTSLWTETWNGTTSSVVTSSGNFNVMLGSFNPIPASFFADHAVTYLGIKVGNDSEMLPRQKITSVGYAFNAGNGVPKGGIIMWSGAVNQIPGGWALCDGQTGTPDLRDRFVVGAGSSYAVGATGGEAMHVLTISEMPSHTHAQDAHSHTVTANQTLAITGTGPGIGQGSSDHVASFSGTMIAGSVMAINQNTGGGAAHENRPPYFALAFIMKL